MSASVVRPQLAETSFAMLGDVIYTSPFTTEDLSTTSWVQQDLNGGVKGVELSVSGVFEFATPGVYQIDSQLTLQTPADICSSTGFGGIYFELVPSSNITCHGAGYTYVKMDGVSQIFSPVITNTTYAYVNVAQGETLQTQLVFPEDCVSAGNVRVKGSGATQFTIRRVD
jgi:hypothetical protein